jgi:hypothetical protein
MVVTESQTNSIAPYHPKSNWFEGSDLGTYSGRVCGQYIFSFSKGDERSKSVLV